jgi:hypothetical protein
VNGEEVERAVSEEMEKRDDRGSLKRSHLIDTAGRFSLGGKVTSVIPHKVGHINDTFIVETASAGSKRGSRSSAERYILQRVNRRVFTEPERLMNNIKRVTEVIRERVEERGGNPLREVLSLVPSVDGGHFNLDDDGEYWRCYLYVDGLTVDFVENDSRGIEMAREASGAFGRFQDDLKDINASQIEVTIEDFHNTPVRFDNFLEAVKRDPQKRREKVEREIDFCLKRESLKSAIADGIESGEIPLRVTHNDTKINNIIFDGKERPASREAPRALCVIDLDTVMPGSILYDFGDLVRTTTATAAEDERDLDRVSFNIPLFEALISGYLKSGRDLITESERSLLSTCGSVITFETGLRFLTDYLEGDVYFKVAREHHNLERARTQFKLVQCMENAMGEMERIVAKY